MCELCKVRLLGSRHIHFCDRCWTWTLSVGLVLSDITPYRHRNYGTMKCRLSILKALRSLGATYQSALVRKSPTAPTYG
jgi:hypothetical protein